MFSVVRSRTVVVALAAFGLMVATATQASAAAAAPPTPIDLFNALQPCSTDVSAPLYFWGLNGLTVEGTSPDTNSADRPFITEQFQLWPISDPTQVTTMADTTVVPGAAGVVNFDGLIDGQTYGWQAQAIGTGGASAWSAPCYVTVDNTAPTNPPTITSPNYPTGQRDQGGAPIQLTLGTNGISDVAGYVFSWTGSLPVPVLSTVGPNGLQPNNPYTIQSGGTSTASAGFVQASSVGGPAIVNLIPPSDSFFERLTVASLDRAFNQSPIATYSIFLNQDEPTVSVLGHLPNFGKPTAFKLTPSPGLEAASPVTGYSVEILSDSGQQTVTVPASAHGTGVVTLTVSNPDGEPLIVSSQSADGWISQPQEYFINTAPVVNSSVYPENGSGGGVGVPGTFTFSPPVNGVASYTYAFNDAPPVTVKACADGTAQIRWTPAQSGSYDLNVYATTRNGTQLFPYDYFFTVN